MGLQEPGSIEEGGNQAFTEALLGTLAAQIVKNPPAMRETWDDPWVGKIPQRREWLATPVSLSGEFHGQRSLAGCSPWGSRELEATE